MSRPRMRSHTCSQRSSGSSARTACGDGRERMDLRAGGGRAARHLLARGSGLLRERLRRGLGRGDALAQLVEGVGGHGTGASRSTVRAPSASSARPRAPALQRGRQHERALVAVDAHHQLAADLAQRHVAALRERQRQVQPGGVLGELEALRGARVQDRGGVQVAERLVPETIEHGRAADLLGEVRRAQHRDGGERRRHVLQLLLLALAPAVEVRADLRGEDAVHDDRVDREAVEVEVGERPPRLVDREALGRHDETDGHALGVAQHVAHRQHAADDAGHVGDRVVVGQRDVEHRTGERPRRVERAALVRGDDPVQPPARDVREREQPQGLAGGRAVDDDDVESSLSAWRRSRSRASSSSRPGGTVISSAVIRSAPRAGAARRASRGPRPSCARSRPAPGPARPTAARRPASACCRSRCRAHRRASARDRWRRRGSARRRPPRAAPSPPPPRSCRRRPSRCAARCEGPWRGSSVTQRMLGRVSREWPTGRRPSEASTCGASC